MSDRWHHVPSHLMNRYPPPEELARRERADELQRQIEAERKAEARARWRRRFDRLTDVLVIVPVRWLRRAAKTIEERTRP